MAQEIAKPRGAAMATEPFAAVEIPSEDEDSVLCLFHSGRQCIIIHRHATERFSKFEQTRRRLIVENEKMKTRIYSRITMLLVVLSASMTNGNTMQYKDIIDNRTTGTLYSNHETAWRLVTDGVMGGVSQGDLQLDRIRGRDCLRLQGAVSTANNGGFVQMALDLGASGPFDASLFQGLLLEVSGNGEHYNLHLRTTDLWLPWQSYRYSFTAEPEWRQIRIPFNELDAYRTNTRFDPKNLSRVGLVAIGREFQADLCLGDMRFYSNAE